MDHPSKATYRKRKKMLPFERSVTYAVAWIPLKMNSVFVLFPRSDAFHNSDMTNMHNQNFYVGVVASSIDRHLEVSLWWLGSHRVEWFVGLETGRINSFIKGDFMDLSWLKVSYFNFHELIICYICGLHFTLQSEHLKCSPFRQVPIQTYFVFLFSLILSAFLWSPVLLLTKNSLFISLLLCMHGTYEFLSVCMRISYLTLYWILWSR